MREGYDWEFGLAESIGEVLSRLKASNRHMSFIADRAQVEASATLQILDRVKALKRAGEDVISLSAGEPASRAFPDAHHVERQRARSC